MVAMVREMVCAECRATVDRCWRWCPECGSLQLEDPTDPDRDGPSELRVDWDVPGSGAGWFDDRPPVGSPA
jgi:hypothetical protein